MRTTAQDRTVVAPDIEPQLTDLLLHGRASLPLAPNNRPIAPSEHVASLRKMIRYGSRRPFRHLLEVSCEDVKDGVPLSEVLAPYHRMIAYLESRAAEQRLAHRDRPVAVLTPRVQKEMGDLSLAMLRQANSPESLEAMEAVIREAADLPPVLGEMAHTFELHVVRASTRPTRRPNVEVMR